MEYFKEKLFPEVFKFFLNILSGIILLYVTLFLKKSFEKSDGVLFSLNLSPTLSVLLYAVYVSIFLYFVWKLIKGVRSLLFSYIDHQQEEYVAPMFNPQIVTKEYPLYDHNREYDSFIFRVKYAITSDLSFIPDALVSISEPKCADKSCATNLNVKRSYFGFYKYTCPSCKKKYSSKYNASSFKANLKSVIFSENEKQMDELPF